MTLTGADPATVTITDKSMAVYPGGTLDIHGEPRTGWTHLVETASPGATQLRVQDGGVQQTIAGRLIDERAEVGLLTRNIRIEGDSQSVVGYGGHVIILPGATARIEGASFYRMGQAGKVARYPIHWHLAGDVTGQYVRVAAIWRTNNRCITIHGTDGAVARGNACYDHLGHGYFLEDGAESGNTLDRNLGLVARIPPAAVRLLSSDATPSTFWITNPDNIVTGNAAAGSVGFGFWYALPASPTGLSTGQPDAPRLTPLGAFRDNVAHSNRRPGLNVDDGPKSDGTTETSVTRSNFHCRTPRQRSGSSAISPRCSRSRGQRHSPTPTRGRVITTGTTRHRGCCMSCCTCAPIGQAPPSR